MALVPLFKTSKPDEITNAIITLRQHNVTHEIRIDDRGCSNIYADNDALDEKAWNAVFSLIFGKAYRHGNE